MNEEDKNGDGLLLDTMLIVSVLPPYTMISGGMKPPNSTYIRSKRSRNPTDGDKMISSMPNIKHVNISDNTKESYCIPSKRNITP